MPRVTAIEIVEDRTARSRCDEGFLRVKRYRARNRRADDSASPDYPVDVIERVTVDPGATSEKVHLLAAEVPRGSQQGAFEAPQVGDGSPMEEGAELRWRPLDEAITACERGEIEDAKTEVAFRRLKARLAGG